MGGTFTPKPGFVEHFKKLLGKEYEQFMHYSMTYEKRAIRVNTLKISVKELVKRLEQDWNLEQVPWCREGFWITHRREDRRDIGNLLEHALGYIYVQGPASMVPAQILDPRAGDIVLDIAASPGSKTTQLAQMMHNKGIIIANDYKNDRLKALGLNIQRLGITNTVLTLMYGQRFKDFMFDRILVDAPCSGTGTIRKSFKTFEIWNPTMIKRLAATQKQLIKTAFGNLKPGGTMVYSTCSVEPEENEAVVNHLLKEEPSAYLEPITLPITRADPFLSYGEEEFDSSLKHVLRLWPQTNDTEGFFVAKFRKREEK